MDKIIVLMIVGLLIIGAIALSDILKSQDTDSPQTAPKKNKPIVTQLLMIHCPTILQKSLQIHQFHPAMFHSVNNYYNP